MLKEGQLLHFSTISSSNSGLVDWNIPSDTMGVFIGSFCGINPRDHDHQMIAMIMTSVGIRFLLATNLEWFVRHNYVEIISDLER